VEIGSQATDAIASSFAANGASTSNHRPRRDTSETSGTYPCRADEQNAPTGLRMIALLKIAKGFCAGRCFPGPF